MLCNPPVIDITMEKYDAVLFDLDRVVTKTAKVHAASWKRLFDEYLKSRAAGGIGVVVKDDDVGESPRRSTARYALDDCGEVQQFLEALTQTPQGESR